MRTLLSHPVSPFARKVRIIMAEKKLELQTQDISWWERPIELLRHNPAGEVPVLIEDKGPVVVGHRPICEYLDEKYTTCDLLGKADDQRAEARRLCDWFDEKFYHEVYAGIVGEKLLKRLQNTGSPDSRKISAAKTNLAVHLDYIDWLVERRNWLAGRNISVADLGAAAHLSVLDYIGEVPWQKHREAKNWYARVKSRPSLRKILQDRLAAISPAPHYSDLDF